MTELKFWQAMKALDEGKEIELVGDNTNGWILFNRKPHCTYTYKYLVECKWRIKEQQKRLAHALLKDNIGSYWVSDYIFESEKKAKEFHGNQVVKFPHGEWIEV